MTDNIKRRDVLTLQRGDMLRTKNYGLIEFLRWDDYMGQLTAEIRSIDYGGVRNPFPNQLQEAHDAWVAEQAAAFSPAMPAAVVYPPDGTVSPFTVINLGSGQVQMGDCVHDHRLPALWFGKEGQGLGHEEVLNREAKDGETIAVVTFSNVEGLDVLLHVINRIRSESFPGASPIAATAADAAALIERKAEGYANEFGYGVGGTLCFDRQEKMDHYTTLTELAEEIRALAAPAPTAQLNPYPADWCIGVVDAIGARYFRSFKGTSLEDACNSARKLGYECVTDADGNVIRGMETRQGPRKATPTVQAKAIEGAGSGYDEPLSFSVEVAGPAGYVRFVDFKGATLEDVMDSIRKQGYATAPDEDGFVTMKVKV